MLPAFDEQAHQALRNLGAILREAGGSYTDVMFVQLYLLDMERIEQLNKSSGSISTLNRQRAPFANR